MKKILTPQEASVIAKNVRGEGKRVVLVGGCFDILHIGHIAFLTEAKKAGDMLFVMLESDENIRQIKGPNRPINSQADRAAILEKLEMVDCVILLSKFETDEDYDNLVSSLKPAIIAITADDPARAHKERQAKQTGAKISEVVKPISNRSTTKLIEILEEM